MVITRQVSAISPNFFFIGIFLFICIGWVLVFFNFGRNYKMKCIFFRVNDVLILKRLVLNHPNIIRLYYIFEDKSFMVKILKYLNLKIDFIIKGYIFYFLG